MWDTEMYFYIKILTVHIFVCIVCSLIHNSPHAAKLGILYMTPALHNDEHPIPTLRWLSHCLVNCMLYDWKLGVAADMQDKVIYICWCQLNRRRERSALNPQHKNPYDKKTIHKSAPLQLAIQYSSRENQCVMTLSSQ